MCDLCHTGRPEPSFWVQDELRLFSDPMQSFFFPVPASCVSVSLYVCICFLLQRKFHKLLRIVNLGTAVQSLLCNLTDAGFRLTTQRQTCRDKKEDEELDEELSCQSVAYSGSSQIHK